MAARGAIRPKPRGLPNGREPSETNVNCRRASVTYGFLFKVKS
jgi:hypothetical protein